MFKQIQNKQIFVNIMKRKLITTFFSISIIFLMVTSTVSAVPGGGVWFTDGEENVVLWKSTIESYKEEDVGSGEWSWTQERISTIRYKAESVSEGSNEDLGNYVNVTGAYYEVEGHITPAPDYQNSDSFSPWRENTSEYITDDAITNYHGFWNSLDASLKDLPDEDVPLVFVNSPVMMVAIFIWLFSNVFEIDTSAGDEVEQTNSTIIIEKKPSSIKFKVTFAINVKLSGSYPTESDVWTNSTLTMDAEVIYGSNTNVLHTFLMDIDMSLSKWNNDTKAQVVSTNEHKHSMHAIYPGDVYQDRDIPGYNIWVLFAIMGASLFSAILMKKKFKIIN